MTNNELIYFETHQKTSHKNWLLFVHGAGGSTRTWKRQIESLGSRYNLLLIDLPGHGRNAGRSNVESVYSFPMVAKKIWQVVDHLRIQSIHLIGVSVGTIVCLQMRSQRPENVRSVIMPGAIVKLNIKLRLLANFSLSLAKIIGYPAFYKLSALIMMPRNNHKKSRDVFIKESKVLTTDEFRKWTSLYYGLHQTLKKLFKASIEMPHLLVMGDQDHLFLKPAQKFAQFHSKAIISIIPKCGHVVSIEQAQKFNEICLNFLKTHFKND